ncbi:hypothetical protein TWF694_001190 [Orbilia ellipsospora]|uniref:Short-chain dehydrogenase n=1 Tax=Orbilia ellipsospora TaxID=2528407 RepID=A0AAV9XSD4_9PEZI
MEYQKKMSVLRRTKMKAAININSIKALVVKVLFARLLPHQKLEHQDLTGKNAIVTGSNTGLGKEMARHLAEMNATVYLACRNMEKAEAAKQDILKSVPKATIHIVQLDTSTLENCARFCDTWDKDGKTVDILMHNAGVGGPPDADHVYGPDGYEHMYMTNFLSNVLITHRLEKYFAPNARVVMTASPGCYVGGFTPRFAKQSVKNEMEVGFHYVKGQLPTNSILYCQSKLSQLCFAKALNKKWRLEGKDYVAHAFNPGYAASDFFQTETVKTSKRSVDPIWWLLTAGFNLALPSREGCKTGVMCAVTPSKKVASNGGRLFDRMKPNTSIVDMYGDQMFEDLWNRWCVDSGISWSYLTDELHSEGSVDEISTAATMEK